MRLIFAVFASILVTTPAIAEDALKVPKPEAFFDFYKTGYSAGTPACSGKDPLKEAAKLWEAETADAYYYSVVDCLSGLVKARPADQRAKAMLATAHLRLFDNYANGGVAVLNEVRSLLYPEPPRKKWTVEYAVALAEYNRFVQRFGEATRALDQVPKKQAKDPEVLHQRAVTAWERGDLDEAYRWSKETIKVSGNPRHEFFLARLAHERGESTAGMLAELPAKQHVAFGPGHAYFASISTGQPELALAELGRAFSAPHSLGRARQSDASLLAARLLKERDPALALRFVDAALPSPARERLRVSVLARLPDTKDYYSQLEKGLSLEEKNPQAAEIEYIRALESDRKNGLAYCYLGALYERAGRVNDAINRYHTAWTEARSGEAAVRLARLLAHGHETEEARSVLEASEVARAGVDYAEVALAKGELYGKTAGPELEGLALRGELNDRGRISLVEPDTIFADALVRLGDSAERDQRELFYAWALHVDPGHAHAAYRMAVSLIDNNRPADAIRAVQLREARFKTAPMMTALAMTYLRTGDQTNGKNLLQNAIRLNSRYAEAFRLLGDLTKSEGDHQTDYNAKRHSYRYALASYEMYSKLAPEEIDGYLATAELYFDIRDLGAAAKNYHKVLELAPQTPGPRLRLAQISRNGGDEKRATELLDQEIALHPATSDQAWVEKGNIHMAKKQFEEAAVAFTRASANPNNVDARFGLGVVHHLLGSYGRALSLFEEVARLDPLKADVYWQMGLIHQKQFERASAIEDFKKYKGIVREPISQQKADEKIRQLTGAEFQEYAQRARDQMKDMRLYLKPLSVKKDRRPASVQPKRNPAQ